MKKTVALLLSLLLIVGITVGAFAARDPKTCSHEWGYYWICITFVHYTDNSL